jgi:hypothetical protein
MPGNVQWLKLPRVLGKVFSRLVGTGSKRRTELGDGTPMVTDGGARRGRTRAFAREGRARRPFCSQGTGRWAM